MNGGPTTSGRHAASRRRTGVGSFRARFRTAAATLASILLAGPALVSAQAPQVVSSRVALSSAEASLHVAFSSGDPLEVAFRDGRVLIGGESVGDYQSGGALETEWRDLLEEAAGLPPAGLSDVLSSWRPTGLVDAGSEGLAERLESELDRRFAALQDAAAAEPPAAADTFAQLPGTENLLRRPERLRLLASALEDVEVSSPTVQVDGSLSVPAGEELVGTAVVVEGELDVAGTLRGDAVVVGGVLRLREGGRIAGNVRLADAVIEREGGQVDGTVSTVSETIATTSDPGTDPAADAPRIDRDLRDEIRDRARDRSSSRGVLRGLRNVGSGLLGLFQNLVGYAIALALSALVVRFAPRHLDRVTTAVRRTPGRSAVVGLAGGFLLVPAYVLGILALSLSIIGIPALLLWLPLFPLAAGLAATLGYLAVARLVGEWITRQRFQSLRFLRDSNTLHCLAAGLAALIVPFAAAHVVEIGGNWLDVLRGLLIGIGWLGGFLAMCLGFGAVLLTRGGRVPGGGGWGGFGTGGGFGGKPPPPPPDQDAASRWSDPGPGDEPADRGGSHRPEDTPEEAANVPPEDRPPDASGNPGG